MREIASYGESIALTLDFVSKNKSVDFLAQFRYYSVIAMNKGTLSIVATPIGNLGDITLRAIETLKSADLILCEDTRVTVNLLRHLGIEKQTMSYHEHSDDTAVRKITALLDDGKNLALVTDAGTPGISDPGNKLVEFIANSQPSSRPSTRAQVEGESIEVTTIPGPSAVVAALSISGFPTDKFLFLGFPPHKNKRKKFFETVAASEYTTVFYESSHRIKKALGELTEVLGGERQVCVCRELTKKFESIYRGSIQEINAMDIPDKGEFVIIISHDR